MSELPPKLKKWDERSRPVIAVAALAPLGSVAAILASSFGEENHEAPDMGTSDLVGELQDLEKQVAELSRIMTDSTGVFDIGHREDSE